ncbi:50S ribosomal protein L6 [Candidatus Giovannonibacteria bacterium]|nr:50S ribosomal protein L6 [Candidatus Giovannonibacteria bacterium]
MSRLGKKPILIPTGVTVEISGSRLRVQGPKGELEREFGPFLSLEEKDGTVIIVPKREGGDVKSLWGTGAALVKNMMAGVATGFSKKLEMVGIGFKAQLEGRDLALSLGFSHPVKFKAPEGITFQVEKNVIAVSGIDKEKVGLVAAQLRELKKPEPYKGKGIRYLGEVVRRKAGKKAVSAGG